MTYKTIIDILVLFVIAVGALAFLSGYCFGKADGIRQASDQWQNHLKKYVDPYIRSLKDLIKFYKENSFIDKLN